MVAVTDKWPQLEWMFRGQNDINALPGKIAAQIKLGVPYPVLTKHEISDMVETQSQEIAKSLVDAKVYLPAKPDLKGDDLRNYLAKTEVVALIAYVQKLGAYKEVKKDHVQPSLLDPDSHRTTAK